MEKLVFNYRNRQGYPVGLKMSETDVKEFEASYTDKVLRKYGDTLIVPKVEVVTSNDGTKMLDVHLLADGVLS